MSHDLAVWVGDAPESDAAALAEYMTRMEAMEAAIDGERDSEPHPRLLAFADALLARYPDLDDGDDVTPWADGPLKGNVVGDIFYFAMTHSAADAAMPFIVDTSDAHGLVCFDPQTETLRTLAAKDSRPSRRWFRRG